jgi:hypothetical protein
VLGRSDLGQDFACGATTAQRHGLIGMRERCGALLQNTLGCPEIRFENILASSFCFQLFRRTGLC